MPHQTTVSLTTNHATGDHNNGVAIVNALGFEVMEPFSLSKAQLGEQVYPDVLIDNAQPGAALHPYIKGDLARKAYNTSHDDTFTVRLNQPDINLRQLQHHASYTLNNTVRFIPHDIGRIHQFGADLSIIYSHQVHDLDEALTSNIMVVDTIPTRVTRERIAAAEKTLEPRYHKLKGPIVMLVVGERVNAEEHDCISEARRVATEAANAAAQLGGSLVVTTSPRTTEASTAVIREILAQKLPKDRFILFDYKKEPATHNPYLGMLGKADRVIVTSDSMSMLSDVIASGKPLFVFQRKPSPANALTSDPPRMYQDEYVELLRRKGYVQDYATLGNENVRHIPAYNSAQEIAEVIKRRMAQRRINGVHNTPIHINAPDYLVDAPTHSSVNMDAIHAAYTRGEGPFGERSQASISNSERRALAGLVHCRPTETPRR